jgi:hypothetical protein
MVVAVRVRVALSDVEPERLRVVALSEAPRPVLVSVPVSGKTDVSSLTDPENPRSLVAVMVDEAGAPVVMETISGDAVRLKSGPVTTT